MPASITSVKTAQHYTWGGVHGTDCDGWYLLQSPAMQIIEERMPSGTRETRHHHREARQFFYVLEGQLTMEVEHHEYVLSAGEGIEIAPGQVHQARNQGVGSLRILVTSQPPSHGDRVEEDK